MSTGARPIEPHVQIDRIDALFDATRMADAVRLAESLWAQPLAASARLDLAQRVAQRLLQAGLREQARPWIDAVGALGGEASQVERLRQLTRAPDYLPPEVYDPIEQTVLYRYAPRECDTYQYVIDILGTCNLRCPSCPVANSDAEGRPGGHMSLRLFEAILDKIAGETPVPVPAIWLFNWGEPTLHPELPVMVQRIRDYGWRSAISSNLSVRRAVERIAACPPDVIKVSISGFTDASYQRSHTGGDLSRVTANLHSLAAALKASPDTQVHVGHHLYRHTLADQAGLKSLCATLGFAYHPIQAFWQPIERNHDLIAGKNLADPLLQELLVAPADNAAFVRTHRDRRYDCELRFNQTVINVDGSVALCCGVYEADNMLGLDFLATPRAAIEAAKYRHPFCKTCRDAGTDYSLIRLPETLQQTPGQFGAL